MGMNHDSKAGTWRTQADGETKPGSRAATAYLYILPALAIYLVFVLWPILDTVRYSFYAWDGFSTPTFIGLDNYLALPKDEVFRKSILNNIAFIFFFSILPIVVGLTLAVLLTRRRSCAG